MGLATLLEGAGLAFDIQKCSNQNSIMVVLKLWSWLKSVVTLVKVVNSTRLFSKWAEKVCLETRGITPQIFSGSCHTLLEHDVNANLNSNKGSIKGTNIT